MTSWTATVRDGQIRERPQVPGFHAWAAWPWCRLAVLGLLGLCWAVAGPGQVHQVHVIHVENQDGGCQAHWGPMGVNLARASECLRACGCKWKSTAIDGGAQPHFSPGGIFGGLWALAVRSSCGPPFASLIVIAVPVCVCACQDPRTHRAAGWTRVQTGRWANETRPFERRVARPQRVGTDFHDEGPGEEASRDSRLC